MQGQVTMSPQEFIANDVSLSSERVSLIDESA